MVKVEYINSFTLPGDTRQIDLVKASADGPVDKPTDLLFGIRHDQEGAYGIYFNVESFNACMRTLGVDEPTEPVKEGTTMYKVRVMRYVQMEVPAKLEDGGIDVYFRIPETTGTKEQEFLNYTSVFEALCDPVLLHLYTGPKWFKDAVTEVENDAKVNSSRRLHKEFGKKVGKIAAGAGCLLYMAVANMTAAANPAVGAVGAVLDVAITKTLYEAGCGAYGMLTATNKQVVNGVTLEDIGRSRHAEWFVRHTRATIGSNTMIFGVRYSTGVKGYKYKPMLHVESLNECLRQNPMSCESVSWKKGIVLVRRTTQELELDNPLGYFKLYVSDNYFVVDKAGEYKGEYVTADVLFRLQDATIERVLWRLMYAVKDMK